MKLSLAIVACDLNPHYLAFWPIVRDAWKNIVGIRCKMILIADKIPENIMNTKDDIILFDPIPGINTAFQAQCIRNLYPALVTGEEGIIISDIDMIPLSKSYFIDTIKELSDDCFFSYRGVHHDVKQIWMCYVIAHSHIWKEVFKVNNIEEIQDTLRKWNNEVIYDGRHGGKGWFTDQLLLYKYISEWNKRIIYTTDEAMSFKHLDRVTYDWLALTDELKTRLDNGYYKDFHMPPFEQYKKQIMDIYNYLIKN